MRAQNDPATARTLLSQVVTTRQRLLGVQHPDTTVAVAALWTLLQTLGETEAAADVRRIREQLQQQQENAETQR